ncbi:transmembrane protein 17-like [Ruditapes philippinarum]|uniref:transmembrane protein 17-like n=1 Tax=Ruditapes philippinarum TaxID=129788 RepID=UPI00295B7520|nr:transmembrane protein 17-like [Ruditapes philippinarum]
MEATFRRTMTSVTDTLFPVSKSAKDPQKHQILKAGNDYVTNLPLQMAIYFNAFFSPFWIIVTLVGFEVKYEYLSILYKITLIAVYVTYTIIEVVRLYVGYIGNLMERVPELAGFWLLTLLIQFPLILLVLFNEDAKILPFERAVNIIEALFVLFEIICGYIAIRIMVNYQVTKFHLRIFYHL